ncbi:MAG: E2F family transcription factor [archaeon]|nr:E2F family transcription factor [archaeon]
MNKEKASQIFKVKQSPGKTIRESKKRLRNIKDEDNIVERENSALGRITVRLMKILLKSKDKIIRVNEVATQLRVKRRRVYDITNVFQSLGYITKIK